MHCGGHGIVRSAERILTSILGRGSLTPLLSRVSLPIILSCHRRCYPLGRHPSLCPIAPSPPTTLPPKTSPCRASGFDDRDGACEHTHTKLHFPRSPPPNGTMLRHRCRWRGWKCNSVRVLMFSGGSARDQRRRHRDRGVGGVDQVFAPGQIDCVCVSRAACFCLAAMMMVARNSCEHAPECVCVCVCVRCVLMSDTVCLPRLHTPSP